MKKSLKIAIASFVGISIIAGSVIFAVNILGDHRFRLDDEYYTTSEDVSIDKDEYEKLISDKKSFVVMIDKPGCVTTETMREDMANSTDLQFKYYRMMWKYVKESSLHEYIKFAPSVAIIRKGEVKAWLSADKDEDSRYFNDIGALKEWLEKYIIF